MIKNPFYCSPASGWKYSRMASSSRQLDLGKTFLWLRVPEGLALPITFPAAHQCSFCILRVFCAKEKLSVMKTKKGQESGPGTALQLALTGHQTELLVVDGLLHAMA